MTACSELKSSEGPVGKEITVLIDEQSYDTKSFEIAQGDTVIFENVGEEPNWPASNIHPTHRMYPEAGAEYCGTDEQLTSFDACASLMPVDSCRFKLTHP